MRLLKAMLAVFVLDSILIPPSLWAQATAATKPSCLEQAAAKIRQKSKVTVVRWDASKHTGLLDSVDLGSSHLLLRGLSLEDSALTLFGQDEIVKIQYDKPGKLKPGYMVLGLFGGALIGGLIGLAFEGEAESGRFPFPPPVEKFGAFLTGAAVGGGVGLLAGTFIPLLPKTRSIECR